MIKTKKIHSSVDECVLFKLLVGPTGRVTLPLIKRP